MKLFVLLFVASVSCSPLEIINYEDAEAGHGHMMSGVPGEMVEGSFFWKAPEGDNIKLVYTAGEEGYLATGDHLPVSPDVPAAPQMVLPVMVDYTPEVAEARSAFMKVFDEVKMRQVEDNVVDDDAVAVEAVERRRRDADPLLVNYQHPVVRSYAPAYPHYYVYPVQQKVMPEMKEDVDMKEEDDMEMEMEMEVMEKKLANPVYYAPSYPYYPVYPSVVYPQVSTEKKVVTSPVSVPSVQVRYPQYPLYPQFYPVYPGHVSSSVVTTVAQPQQSPARVLPEQKQVGEDEPAALLL